VKTGIISPHNLVLHGFSYIELMISILIISTGFIGYSELILRIKYTQQQVSANLQLIMQADYQRQNALIHHSLCAKP
jgi:Tfp pilus assembly protein PilV